MIMVRKTTSPKTQRDSRCDTCCARISGVRLTCTLSAIYASMPSVFRLTFFA